MKIIRKIIMMKIKKNIKKIKMDMNIHQQNRKINLIWVKK